MNSVLVHILNRGKKGPVLLGQICSDVGDMIFHDNLPKIDLHWQLANYLWLFSPSAAYMRQWTGSALVQMSCRLFGVII